jgi:flagellar L-ring protein precursor FlgH
MKRLCLTLTMAVILPGCAVHRLIEPPSAQQDLLRLEAELDILPPVAVPASSSGSLWTDDGPGAALARDTRAFRTNDLLTIVLAERSVGRNQGETELNRSSSSEVGAPIALGLEKANPITGSFNINQLLSTTFESEFAGDGETSRENLLTGNITTRVMRVLPNGDLVVAGQKTIMINRERHILTLVGSVRPYDINGSNQVASSAVGDLTVRLWGKGELDSTLRQGWFHKFLNRFWPF